MVSDCVLFLLLLPDASQDQETETLMFTSYPTPSACFASSTVGPVTSDTLLRWLNMLNNVSKNGTLTVRRVSLRPLAPFQFAVKPLKVSASSDVLARGNYGCFYAGAYRTQSTVMHWGIS
ncbi:uncharacterized protein C8Q71DRAFT_150809 [Rhodofomes roseus]|uniref:Secreted protein n=1 Tax=Rhodofomes roseus TaxID=34475 RepID=A0ABQ8KAT2_9APHY|nr:uncharacterized protein C8Q71DRAFT_150809 [Rhodofomes roseus]KAH9834622.1 hypothetical protein C8Q71DRAFT_150809 [Rhodofomes roseus]